MENPPNIKQKIFKETLIYSIGSFGSKILSFLLIPFYTFFLTKKELGEYDLLITTVSLFIPLVSLQLSDSTYRWLIDKEKHEEDSISKILSNSLLGYIISFIIFIFFFLIFTFFEKVDYSLYFLILLFLNGLLPFLQSILRGIGDTKTFAKNGVITSFFIVFFNIIFIYLFKLKVEGILLANIIANIFACLLIIYQLKVYRQLNYKLVDKKMINKMLSYSLPLIPNLMSWWLIGSASKYVILHFLGSESNGLYAISSRFPSLLVIINSVLVLPLQDGILKKKSNLLDYKDLIESFFKLEFYFILLLIAFSPIFTKIIVSDAFYESWKYMGFLFMGVGYNTLGSILGFYYLKNMNTTRVTITTIIGAIISIVLSFLLIKNFNLIGVSFAYMFGFFIMFYIRFFDVKKKFGLEINHVHIILSLIFLIALIITLLYLNFISQLFLSLISLFFVLLLNKKLLNKLNIKKYIN